MVHQESHRRHHQESPLPQLSHSYDATSTSKPILGMRHRRMLIRKRPQWNTRVSGSAGDGFCTQGATAVAITAKIIMTCVIMVMIIVPSHSILTVHAQHQPRILKASTNNSPHPGTTTLLSASESSSAVTDTTSTTTTTTPKIRVSSSTTKDSPVPSPAKITGYDTDTSISNNHAATIQTHPHPHTQPQHHHLPTAKLSAFTAPIPMAYVKGARTSGNSGSAGKIGSSTADATGSTDTEATPLSQENLHSQTIAATSSTHSNLPPSLQQQLEEQEFLQWCHDALNISTSMVHIQHFPYHRSSIITTLQKLKQQRLYHTEDDDDFERTEDDNYNDDIIVATDTPDNKENRSSNNDDDDDPNDIIWIRGLAASRDIVPDDIILRIPVQSLFSVVTIIDDDPVLSKILGPEARAKYGWNDEDEYNDVTGTRDMSYNRNTSNNQNPTNDHYYSSSSSSYQMYEIPLLTIALLYHRSIGTESSIYRYIKLLQRSPVDHLPYTWTEQQWKEYTTARRSWSFDTVWSVAKEIRHEIKYMYKHVVTKILVKEYPHIFGRNMTRDPLTNEWMYSFSMFQWAYAIVNSRHWQLPNDTLTSASHDTSKRNTSVPDQVQRQQHQPQQSQKGLDQVPPADKPTESWVLEHGDVDDDRTSDDATLRNGNDNASSTNSGGGRSVTTTADHSFLAPVADLLNFGPPCTRVKYNYETHTFDTFATCKFVTGQEITFWYSNECSDVMMGMYGFTHPLITPCTTNEALQYRTKILEQKLHDAYTDMKMLEDDLEYVEKILADCDCCDAVPLTGLGGEGRDPMISTMALHEEKNSGSPQLRHLDDTTSSSQLNPDASTTGRAVPDSSRAASRSRQGPRIPPTSTTTAEDVPVVKRDVQHDVDKNHLLVRRTRRWSSQTSEF